MHPNHLSIMEADHNRMSRRQDAEQYRLRKGAGLETDSVAGMGRVVTAVVSVAKEINDPRYPSFMGIRKANKAQIPTVTPSTLGMTPPAPQSHWTNIRKPEVRQTQVQLIDGATVQEKAAKLVDALLAEKVI